MKKVVLMFAILSFMFARDNPFEPVVSSKNIGKATNIGSGIKPLKVQYFKLPSSVRVLKKIKLQVLNVDGSIKEITYDINKKIDWHNDFVIANSKLQIDHKERKIEPKILNIFNFLTILVDQKKLLIKTKDTLIRELFFAKPYKIAIDFKRNVAFYTKTIKLKNSPYSKIIVGNHGNFYRVVLELDGEYRYKIKKNSNGYLVELF